MDIYTPLGKRKLSEVKTPYLTHRVEVVDAQDKVDRRIASRTLDIQIKEVGSETTAQFKMAGSRTIDDFYAENGVSSQESLIGEKFYAVQDPNGRKIEGIMPYKGMNASENQSNRGEAKVA